MQRSPDIPVDSDPAPRSDVPGRDGFGPLPTDDDALAAAYCWPAPTGHTITRANMVGSLDGGATVAGRSAGLSCPADVALFAVLRDLADVVLVGAGTVRAEKYAGVKLDGDRAERRRRWGFDGPPPIAVVTAHGLPADLPFFTRTSTPPIVITCGRAATTVPAGVDAIVAGDDSVDLGAAIAELGARGLRRVHCEGGPTLFGELVDAGLLDEMCLTISPRLLGAGTARPLLGGRDLVGPDRSGPDRSGTDRSGTDQTGTDANSRADRAGGVTWSLTSAYTADDHLFTRYRREDTR